MTSVLTASNELEGTQSGRAGEGFSLRKPRDAQGVDAPHGGGPFHQAIRDVSLPAEVEVGSARPHWIELRIPGDLVSAAPLENLLAGLVADLPDEAREAIGYAFRELLNNALEHGCALCRAKRVEISFVRLERAFAFRIKDPGPGFDPARLDHAAVGNPGDDPVRHLSVRDATGLRPGGFGILLTSQMADELIYNERHNEVMFVKYLF